MALGQRKEKKIEAATIKNYYKVVKAFCLLHRINLERPRIKRYIGKVKKIANDRAPSLDEMKTWMEYDDRRIKLVILVMSSCGMRVGAWSYLQWKHVKPIARDGQIIAAKLTVYAGEGEEEYITFITPEAYESLDKWMKLREQHGEKINQDSYLMRDTWAWDYGIGAANPQNKTVTVHAVKKLLNKSLWEQGIRTKPQTSNGANRYEFKTTHGLRKWFKTRAEQAGMKLINVELLMGHSVG